MIVLGIDPGTAVTGYGVVLAGGAAGSAPGAVAGARLIECGVIRTSAQAPLHERLKDIHDGVTELIARHQPDALAVEDVFYARNVRTTLVLGHARGVILLAGATAGLAIHEYPPSVIKKTVVGTGAATKEQVQFMVAKLLRLKHAPQPADAADGVACALTCVLASEGPLARLRRDAAALAPLRAVRPAARRTGVTRSKS
ncbi:MAG: crossover junction endodeoxyribonuclease RuvC [Gemmatimonadetes bacterium]|nr:crossover junction endodeoxyribonuclease RuvC [Gemmatimonadota bacterium]